MLIKFIFWFLSYLIFDAATICIIYENSYRDERKRQPKRPPWQPSLMTLAVAGLFAATMHTAVFNFAPDVGEHIFLSLLIIIFDK